MPAGVYGIPRAARFARVVQFKTNTSGGGNFNITLNQAPTAGNILVAYAGTVQVGSVSISGGGSTNWTLFAHPGSAAGNQADLACWVGNVGPGASSTVTINTVNNSSGMVIEIAGALGVVRQVASDATFGAPSVAAIKDLAEGFAITLFASRGGGAIANDWVTIGAPFGVSILAQAAWKPNYRGGYVQPTFGSPSDRAAGACAIIR